MMLRRIIPLIVFIVAHLAASGAPASFQLVGVNPVASQTAFPGLGVLHAWDGRVYMGYGNVNSHPGPIIITSFDPVAKDFVAEFSAGSDLVKIFREIGGKLYIPSADGIHYGGFDDYIVLTGRSQGYSRTPLGMFHMWDICTLDGSDLWAVGTPWGMSKDARNGRGWTHLDTGGALPHSCFSMNGLVYTPERTFQPNGAWEANSLSGSWYKAHVITTPSGQAAVARSGGGGFAFARAESDLVSFDGQQPRTHFPVWDFAIDGGTVYALRPDLSIFRASDILGAPNRWENLDVADLPDDAWSLAVLDGVIYCGTLNGELWAARIGGGDPDDYSHVGFLDELPDRFGASIAMSGDRLLVGAPHQGGTEVQEGRAYLYQRNGEGWDLEREFTQPPPAQQSGYFGSAVALSSQYLAIVAEGHSEDGYERGQHARVHAYQMSGGQWEEFPWSPLEIVFAQSVAVSDEGWLAVGADAETPSTQSRYLIYQMEAQAQLVQTLNLTASQAYRAIPRVEFDGSTLVLARRGDPSRSGGPGHARVYEFDDPLFATQGILNAELAGEDWFGQAVNHRSGLLAVGAPYDDTQRENAGAVHLYPQVGGYLDRITIYAPEALAFATFGSSVALGSGVLVVGARDDEGAGKQTGAAYLYRRNAGGQWEFDYKIAPPPSVTSAFGVACAVSGNTAAIGGTFSGRGTGALAELDSRLRLIDLTPCPLKSWGGTFGLSDLETLNGIDKDEDDLAPLVEFAFNLSPVLRDRRHLARSSGVSGLPVFEFTESATFEIEFVRRLEAGLTYELQSSVDGATWQSEAGWSERVENIDATWDRVILSKAKGPAPRTLYRFSLSYTTPAD